MNVWPTEKVKEVQALRAPVLLQSKQLEPAFAVSTNV